MPYPRLRFAIADIQPGSGDGDPVLRPPSTKRAAVVNDVLSILAQVPEGRALGLFYWEPEWIPGVGWEPGAGTPNDNLTLFSFTGQALPSVGLFESPLAVCAHYAPYSQPCTVPGGASAGPGAC